MLLSRIHLNLRCKETRRDLADPYQMHSTLCRAFSDPDVPCPPGTILWRLEPETDDRGNPRILVQSHQPPDWSRLGLSEWLGRNESPLDLEKKLDLASLKASQHYRFRLRANPCVKRNGKRLGLFNQRDQSQWIIRKGELHGFTLQHQQSAFYPMEEEGTCNVRMSQEQMLKGRQHNGNQVLIYSVLFEGVLVVDDPEKFRQALKIGIGHGKVLGLGLLSVVPVS